MRKRNPSQTRRESMLAHLHELEAKLNVRALDELIRMIESEKFRELTCEHIQTVGQYSPIEINGERFFDKAFTTGKEVAGSLGYARHIGRRRALSDLIGLRASLAAETA